MFRELLANKETFTRKYIGLKCIVPKGTEYFNILSLGGFDYPSYIQNNQDEHYYASKDIQGEISSVILGNGVNNKNSLNTYFIVYYHGTTNGFQYIHAMICRKSDVKIDRKSVV